MVRPSNHVSGALDRWFDSALLRSPCPITEANLSFPFFLNYGRPAGRPYESGFNNF